MATKKKVAKIKATLKLLGRYYTAEGKTVEETLNKIKAPVAKTLGILTLEKGDLKKEKIIPPRLVMGVFGKQGRTIKDMAMKNITILFNDFND